MGLALIGAKAAVLRKQASLGRLAAKASVGLGAAGGLGLAAYGVNDALSGPDAEPEVVPVRKPVPVAGPAEPDLSSYAKRQAANKMTLRDRIRQRTTDAIASGAGGFLGKWHGHYTGKGQ